MSKMLQVHVKNTPNSIFIDMGLKPPFLENMFLLCILTEKFEQSNEGWRVNKWWYQISVHKFFAQIAFGVKTPLHVGV